MKIIRLTQISLVIILPFNLLSQEINKLTFLDSIIDVNKTLENEFGNEWFQQSGQINKHNSLGILQFTDILNNSNEGQNYEGKKIPGVCQCYSIDGIVEISNAIGFMAGIGNIININLEDSTYYSRIVYHTDGAKIHKNKPEEDFIESIQIILQSSKLEISPDSNFKHNGIIKGRIIGESYKYYERDNSDIGYKKVKTKVFSIFECQIEDVNTLLKIEQEKTKKD